MAAALREDPSQLPLSLGKASVDTDTASWHRLRFPIVADVICYRLVVLNPRRKSSFGDEVLAKNIHIRKV